MLLPNGIIILFCYYFFMLKKGDINSVYYHAAGLWWNGRYRSIVEAILNVVLNYFLGKRYGLFGIILATIISFSIVNVYGASVVFTKYFKNKKYLLYILENFFFLICISASCALTYFLGNTIISYLEIKNIVLVLFVKAGICLVIPNICMLLVYGCIPQYRRNIRYATEIIRGVKA